MSIGDRVEMNVSRRVLLLLLATATSCGGPTKVKPQLVRMPDPQLPRSDAPKWEFKVPVEVCIAENGTILRAVTATRRQPDSITDAETKEQRGSFAAYPYQGALDSAAVATARMANFLPARENGLAVQDCTIVDVLFNRGRKLSAPELQDMDPVEYPDQSREAGDQGIVLVRCLVSTLGVVEDAAVIQGVSELIDQASLRAVRSAVFKPGRVGGEQVAVWMIVPLEFKIHN